MDWITNNIAIGNYIDARNLAEGDVDAVLCLINNCCEIDEPRFDVEVIPLADTAGNRKRPIDDCVDFIHNVVSTGDKILVHCHAGQSRSVCITARYFMIKHGLTSHQALAKLEEKREIYLSPGIEEILFL
jgi:dual specificity phosphatase 12